MTLGVGEPFFANFSHAPVPDAWLASSHARHSRWSAASTIGSSCPVLIVDGTLSSGARMAKEAPLYDLMLLLSTSAEDEQRKKILADVESSISGAGGSIERNDDWGERPMAYEIRHQPAADYHLLQFKAPPTLIEELSHTLRITDGVVRFRVIKVRPGTPDAPSSPPPVVAAVASSSHSGASAPGAGGGAERPSEPAESEADGSAGAAVADDSGDEASAES